MQSLWLPVPCTCVRLINNIIIVDTSNLFFFSFSFLPFLFSFFFFLGMFLQGWWSREYVNTLAFPDLHKAWEILEVQTLPPTHTRDCAVAPSLYYRGFMAVILFWAFFFSYSSSPMSHTEIYVRVHSLTYSLNSFIHLFTCSLTHSSILTHTHSYALTFTHKLTHSYIHSHTHSQTITPVYTPVRSIY